MRKQLLAVVVMSLFALPMLAQDCGCTANSNQPCREVTLATAAEEQQATDSSGALAAIFVASLILLPVVVFGVRRPWHRSLQTVTA